MFNSGATAQATTGQQTITLLQSTGGYGKVVLINEGPTAGFFSLDGTDPNPNGATPGNRLPAASSATSPIVITLTNPYNFVNLRVSGNGLSGLWAWAI